MNFEFHTPAALVKNRNSFYL